MQARLDVFNGNRPCVDRVERPTSPLYVQCAVCSRGTGLTKVVVRAGEIYRLLSGGRLLQGLRLPRLFVDRLSEHMKIL